MFKEFFFPMVAALTGEDKTKWCGKKCITYKIPPQFMKHEIVGQNNKLCVTLISILNVTDDIGWSVWCNTKFKYH